jgi:hypothetical protein
MLNLYHRILVVNRFASKCSLHVGALLLPQYSKEGVTVELILC